MARTRDIRNAYDIINSRGELVTTIYEREVDNTSTTLTLHGRGFWPYGTRRNNNIVALVENFSGDTPPSPAIGGQLWWKRNDELYAFEPLLGSPGWRTVVPPSAGIGFSVTPGDGMDQASGGLPTGSPLTTTLTVGAGRGFTFVDGGLNVSESQVRHDDLLNFVANEHIDHDTIKLVAGDGMVNSGSPASIASSVNLNIVGAKGITVGSDVAVSSSVWRTTGTQFVTGVKSFEGQMRASRSVSAAAPSYAFAGDTNLGVYATTGRNDEISFSTFSAQRFRIESGGVLRATTSAYETLVADDHDIPNKKYVDTVVGAASNPTENTHVGTSSISGLLDTETYLVHIYGRLSNKGTGTATLEAIRLRRGSTTPGSGTTVAATASQSINWFDGAGLSSATFICPMSGDTSINGRIEDTGSARAASYMTAVQLTEPEVTGSPLTPSGSITLSSSDGVLIPAFMAGVPSIYNCLAAWRIDSSGNAQRATGTTAAPLSFANIGSDWLLSGSASDFEIKVDTVSLTGSGVTAFGTTGVWLDASTFRVWTLQKNGSTVGLGQWIFDVTIRDKHHIGSP